MGVYTEYLDANFSFPDLTAERKKQLKRIAQLRGGRDVLVYAADLTKGNARISIEYSDLVPIADQLSNLHGDALDLIIETPGGSGEVADDIVRLCRGKYQKLGIIIPGWAKSAGTIMAMAGDEILMSPASALGPIDAQLSWQGKVFSADALLEGFEKIKEEVSRTGGLNKAYIPILQGISPGELQSAENALSFAKKLVTEWLVSYKFRDWATHASTGAAVTEDERRQRADQVAEELCNHRRWLTHGRSIKLGDLEKMRLKITDYSKTSDLADAIGRYQTLLKLTFDTNIYKVIETPGSQIYRFMAPQNAPTVQQNALGGAGGQGDLAIVDVDCHKCKKISKVQANLTKNVPLVAGAHPFPADNKFKCPACQTEIDLSTARRQIEAAAKKRVIN